MPNPNISAELTDANMQALADAEAAARAVLAGFLVSLTADEKLRLFKLGDKGLPYVMDCLTAAQNYPTALPASFPVPEFAKDVALFQRLDLTHTRFANLLKAISDTMTVVGSEANRAATQAYGYLQTGADTIPGLRAVVDELAARWDRGPRPTQPPTP